jgi:hypothetical protein
MALLLIVPAWLFIVALVIALCFAAQRGDRRTDEHAAPRPTGEPLAIAGRQLARRLREIRHQRGREDSVRTRQSLGGPKTSLGVTWDT